MNDDLSNIQNSDVLRARACSLQFRTGYTR
jgi:hypothetical protein